MKYEPYYLLVDRIFIEAIVFDAFDSEMTLLVRVEKKHGISSQKHIFCQPNQLGKLLMEDSDEASSVLTRLVDILDSDNIGCPEVVDVESLIGHPLTSSSWQLQLYHPIVENCVSGQDEIDLDLFILDKALPKFS